MWHIQTIYYNLGLKNGNPAIPDKMMKQNIMLNEICPSYKDKYCIISLEKFIEAENKRQSPRARREEEMQCGYLIEIKLQLCKRN